MKYYKEKLVKLPAKGKAMIITDIHGNLEDYHKYMEIWNDFKNKDNHLILTGDYIHGFGDKDKSVEILESVKWSFEHVPNFHVTLGNHELAHVANINVVKGGHNQKEEFEQLILNKYDENCYLKLQQYKKFFKKLPISIKTANGAFISHSGPSRYIKSSHDLENILNDGYVGNPILSEMLWSRYGDYNLQDVDSFLEAVGCKIYIVGHTPVRGVKKIGKKQMIVSSSYGYGPKAYLELDLEKKLETVDDLDDMVRFLD